MAFVDIAAQNLKEAELIVQKSVIALQKATKHVGFIDKGFVGREYVVTVETNLPEFMNDLIEAQVAKSSRATLVSCAIHDGYFDWASDTYIKDCSHVVFKF